MDNELSENICNKSTEIEETIVKEVSSESVKPIASIPCPSVETYVDNSGECEDEYYDDGYNP